MFNVTPLEQYRTIDSLVRDSQPSNLFELLLVLSSLIITSGILLNNVPIIIGGMLVTPLLTPILFIALGFSMGRPELILSTGKLVGRSVLAIIFGAMVLTVLFGSDVTFPAFTDSLSAAFLYFVVAIASGIAVTMAWIKQELSEVIPGISIAVSLVPPIAYIGVALARFDIDTAVFFLIVFALNLFGIILGSIGVFSISRFSQAQHILDEELEEEKESSQSSD